MKTIVFDLDGTLCDISHRLPLIKCEKPDWDSFFMQCAYDAPKPDIIFMFGSVRYMAQLNGYRVIIVSGRSDKVRAETVEWLMNNNCMPDELVMRKNGDHTPDDKLKRSWLNDGLLGPKENILFCVDDRQRVVDMWREEGLTCLQVAAWEE